MKHHRILTIAILTATLASATAAEFFVAPAPLGADTNPGTREAPKADVQQVIWSLKPGDTLTLLPGTYTQPFSFAKSGTAEAPIIVRGDASGGVILDGGALPAAGPEFSMIAVSANFITVEGLDIRHSPGWGISVWGKTNAILRGNKITGCSWSGIQLANERPFHGHPNPSADNLIEEKPSSEPKPRSITASTRKAAASSALASNATPSWTAVWSCCTSTPAPVTSTMCSPTIAACRRWNVPS